MAEPAPFLVTPSTRERWMECQNDTSPAEEIPGSALLRVTGVTSTGIIKVAKPDTNDQVCMVNGPLPIPAQTAAVPTYGICTRDWPAWILYDTADGTPTVGQSWGAMAGEWKLRSARMGYTIDGGAQSGRAQASLTAMTISGGSLTVRRSDGTQVVLNVTILEVHPPNFWTITQVSAGVARLAPNGKSGTWVLCDALTGEPHTFVFEAGSLRTVDGV